MPGWCDLDLEDDGEMVIPVQNVTGDILDKVKQVGPFTLPFPIHLFGTNYP